MRPAPSTRSDVRALPERHRSFFEEARAAIPEERLFCDPLRTLAYGTDASFYRLVPKVVVRVRTVAEVQAVLALARRHGVPLTFRAAGTSLSGQSVTDSVLVQLDGWKARRIVDGGAAVVLEPGVVGSEANALLAPLGKKIGPDPASIATCQVGGIAANNASGMCCGTAQNSYRTVRAMKLVLATARSWTPAIRRSAGACARRTARSSTASPPCAARSSPTSGSRAASARSTGSRTPPGTGSTRSWTSRIRSTSSSTSSWGRRARSPSSRR
jgi:FAD/FMN-containing dehydrogenase